MSQPLQLNTSKKQNTLSYEKNDEIGCPVHITHYLVNRRISSPCHLRCFKIVILHYITSTKINYERLDTG